MNSTSQGENSGLIYQKVSIYNKIAPQAIQCYYQLLFNLAKMLFCKEFNFIYSKTNKTASTSAEIALEFLIRGSIFTGKSTNSILYPDGSRIGYRGNNPKDDPLFNTKAFSAGHQSLQATCNQIGIENFKSSFKISSIRNPYERMISAFHYRGMPFSRYLELKQKDLIGEIKEEFELFINTNQSAFNDGYAQMYYDSKMVIDYFIHQENFNQDMSNLLDILKVPTKSKQTIMNNIPLKKVNRKKTNEKLSNYFTDSTLSIVNERFSHWFALGNYDKIDSINSASIC